MATLAAVTESALSDEADALYRPLEDLAAWADLRVPSTPPFDPSGDMAAHGALLAAAHESAALDGVIAPDPDRARALLRGVDVSGQLTPNERAHVKANAEALRLALAAGEEELGAEGFLRRLHEVACRPQLTHPVRGDHAVHDHVLATGDYKHHPNHVPTSSGGWVAHAPVAALRDELSRLFAALASPAFAALHPFVRAAFVLRAVVHVAPFADGNGRVARALAGAHLQGATGLPLVVFTDDPDAPDEPSALVGFVADRCAALAALIAAERPDPADVERWRARAEAGRAISDLLPTAVERALARHRARRDLGFLSPLDEVVVATSPRTLALAAPGIDVGEVVTVDPHPVLEEGVVVVGAREAQLRFDVAPDEVAGAMAGRLEPWLDRVVSVLALRVAAELE